MPETMTLAKLHQVSQAVMGWADSHLREFEIAGEQHGICDPDGSYGPPVASETRAKLGTCLQRMKSFCYVCDFGDIWEHKIKMEKMLPPDVSPVPLCVSSANACPPEDVGGPYNYPDFLETIANPAYPEHDQMLEWNDGPFDPTTVDYETIDRRLITIKL